MKFLIAILSILVLSRHRPLINYSVEIYLLPSKHSKTNDSIPEEFEVNKENLPTMPFINDDELVLFDTSSNICQNPISDDLSAYLQSAFEV